MPESYAYVPLFPKTLRESLYKIIFPHPTLTMASSLFSLLFFPPPFYSFPLITDPFSVFPQFLFFFQFHGFPALLFPRIFSRFQHFTVSQFISPLSLSSPFPVFRFSLFTICPPVFCFPRFPYPPFCPTLILNFHFLYLLAPLFYYFTHWFPLSLVPWLPRFRMPNSSFSCCVIPPLSIPFPPFPFFPRSFTCSVALLLLLSPTPVHHDSFTTSHLFSFSQVSLPLFSSLCTTPSSFYSPSPSQFPPNHIP